MEIKIIVFIVIMFFSMIQSLSKSSKEKQEKKAAEQRRAESTDPARKQRVQSEIETFLAEVTGARPAGGPDPETDIAAQREQERLRQAAEEKRRRQLEVKRRQQAERQQAAARASQASAKPASQPHQANPKQTASQQKSAVSAPPAASRAKPQAGTGAVPPGRTSTGSAPSKVNDKVPVAVMANDVSKSVDEHLGRRSAEMPPETSISKINVAANDIAALLRSPTGIRNAMLVNELLSRPRALRTKTK